MSLDSAYFDNLKKHLIEEKYPLVKADLTDIRTYAEHVIIGSSDNQTDNPWIPKALLSGALSVEEVNRLRRDRGIRYTIIGNYFGDFSEFGIGGYQVGFTLELVNPDTLETIRDPQVVEATNLITDLNVPKKRLKEFFYQGPFARFHQNL